MTENTTTKPAIISRDKLLEAGVYFGHKKDRWNPKMKPYIATIKKGTHIIDIEKTKRTIEFAYMLVKNYAKKGATFVFVGTRKHAKKTIKENALRTNSFYVYERWLGGTLTNSRTIFQRVKRMEQLEKLAEKNYEGYTKKEGIGFAKELAKLHRNLSGIRTMRYKPTVMIIADPKADEIAVKEARKLGVKVIGIVDTNNDPSSVDVAIPANDDSLKSINLIITLLADAISEVKGGEIKYAFKKDEEIVLPEEPRKEKTRKPFRKNYRTRNANYSTHARKNPTRSNESSKTSGSIAVKKDHSNKANVKQAKAVKTSDNLKNSKPALVKSVVEEPQAIQKAEVIKAPAAKTSSKAKPNQENAEVISAKTDFSKLTVSQLKELLKAKNLPTSGLKAELIKRLQGA